MAVGKLTGPKKAAILLLALGEEGAAEVMKNLEEAEIQQVGYYMTRFTDISSEELDQVLEEFYRQSISDGGGGDLMASPDFVKNALNAALGAEKAKELTGSMNASDQDVGLDALQYMDPVMISNYIRTEHPQTIALIISYLTNIDKVGGVAPVAEILNSIDKASETRILSTIEESNPDLAEKIRELMFTFEDLTLIDSKQMQTVLKDVDKADLAMALKTASDAVRELIMKSMSTRAAEMLNDDLENMGPVKVSDVESAQQKIIKIVKKLEEEGKLIMAGAGDDVV